MNINGMEYLFCNMLPVPNKNKVREFLPSTVYFTDNSIIKKPKKNKKIKIDIFYGFFFLLLVSFFLKAL